MYFSEAIVEKSGIFYFKHLIFHYFNCFPVCPIKVLHYLFPVDYFNEHHLEWLSTSIEEFQASFVRAFGLSAATKSNLHSLVHIPENIALNGTVHDQSV